MAKDKKQTKQIDKVESTNLGGAPKGNDNAAKGRQVTAMLANALGENDKKRLREGVEMIANAFAEGERWAVDVVFDRLEGKATQTVDTNINGSLDMSINVKFG